MIFIDVLLSEYYRITDIPICSGENDKKLYLLLDAYSRDSVRGHEDLPEGFVLYYTNQKGNHQCAVKDDMQKIYPLFEACDAVVLASPLYF